MGIFVMKFLLLRVLSVYPFASERSVRFRAGPLNRRERSRLAGRVSAGSRCRPIVLRVGLPAGLAVIHRDDIVRAEISAAVHRSHRDLNGLAGSDNILKRL